MYNDLARQADERARLQQTARYEDNLADLHVYIFNDLKTNRIKFASFSILKCRIVGGVEMVLVHHNLEIVDIILKIRLASHEQNGYNNSIFAFVLFLI